jgi:hypothetical protein
MATTGKSAWEKYYKFAGDVSTVIKKDAEAFDDKNPSKVIGTIKQGQEVIVPSVKTYDPKPCVTYKFGGKTCKVRVNFDMLQKPGVKSKTSSDNVKTIANKSLTPDGFGLGGKTILKSSYVREIKLAIDKNNLVPPHIKDFLNELVENSNKSKFSTPKASKEISDKDLAIIAKDFGEISGAWWFLNNYTNADVIAIEFPSKSNERLVDYYGVLKNKLKVSVSAKAGGGAAPSISSVWSMIQGKNFNDRDEKLMYQFIGAITENSGTDGIIMAAKAINSDLYRRVGTIIGKPQYNAADLEEWLKVFKDGNAAFAALDQHLYSKIKRAANVNTLIEMWKSPSQKKSGAILSPMAYALVDEVNQNPKYTKFLTDVVSSNNIQQLYIYLSPGSTEYELRGFAESKFIFEYHSNAANPGGNKIGFKLKK